MRRLDVNSTAPPQHPDDQLPAPLRWATRLFSAWWTLGGLALVIALYLIVAFVPVGGSYIWQTRLIDLPQAKLLTWLPFHLLLFLFVCVLIWTALRRVAWRPRNLGVFIVVLGIAIAISGQSTHWRYQTRGLLAVQSPDAQPLPLQTRYLEPTQRILFVQIDNTIPQQVPLDALPNWHDRTTDAPALPLHQHLGLRSQLNYRAQVHAIAYIAHGTLATHDTVSPTPTPPADREWLYNNCPTQPLVALRFTTNSADGPAIETIVWLPFDIAAGQRAVPPQAYDIAGLGVVRLAFTLASNDLGFAVAAEPDPSGSSITLHIIDTDPTTRQIIPARQTSLADGMRYHYDPIAPRPTLRHAIMSPGPWDRDDPPRWITLQSTTAMGLTYAGGSIALAGLLLMTIIRILTGKPKPPVPQATG